jgi:endonuclease/exonuclease/phosphatase family metal-dependent hydrolase
MSFDLKPWPVYHRDVNAASTSRSLLWSALVFTLFLTSLGAETFRVATYNVENYLDRPTESRPHPKSAEAKAKVRESIRALKPDVLALQEIGSVSALLELRDSLKREGLDLPYWEHVNGFDTNIHVAVLSKFPFAARRPHTNDTFLLSGRRFRVSRGFAEVDVRVNANYSFTLITAHLKSKRPIPEADEAEMRQEEAKVLRKIIDTELAGNSKLNLIVLGDFNNTKDSPSTKTLIGRGKMKLTDTRPAERNGDNAPSENPRFDSRTIAWTHYYGVEDSYSRLDYILLSPGMTREWVEPETYVLTMANWGVGSDHRPLVATFVADER